MERIDQRQRDRRQKTRRRVEWTGEIFDPAQEEDQPRRRRAVVCSDLSSGGMRLVTHDGGQVGDRVWVALNTPSGALRFRGQVVRQRGNQRGELGVKLAFWSWTNWRSMRMVSQSVD